ncbi:MAG: GDSL-type esterase/lipase family protein [Deferribacterales bacterium]
MRKIVIALIMMFSAFSAFAAANTKQTAKPAPQTAAAQADLVPMPSRAKSYERYTEMYGIYNGSRIAKVVMLGDSITQGAYWNELMHRGDIVNRGIPGDTTVGMLDRLDSVAGPSVEHVFVLAGINDIAQHYTTEAIYDRYVRIVDFLKRSGITPHIQSTLYLSNKNPNYAVVNKQVVELNTMLKSYAAKNSIDYIDLNFLLSKGGVMISDYSYDGTHLNSKGYLIWRSALAKYLAPQFDVPVETSEEMPAQTQDQTDQVSGQPASDSAETAPAAEPVN